MDPRLFRESAPGRLVDVTDNRGNHGLAFIPAPLPPAIDFSSKAVRIALSEADRGIARLDGIAKQIERPDLLFQNYLRREAVLSNKIEGTRTTLADLVLFEAAGKVGADRDAHDVANYVRAFAYGRERCGDVRVGRRLMTELHQILMQASDHAQTTPGKVRDCLVVVGQPPIQTARFVPPPHIFVDELVDDLERYLEHDDEAALIRIAIAHYQFEAIHPFRDGNGRIGRLLISLWLQRERVLTTPVLYLSAYFERHRDEYYDALLRVSTENAWEDWLLFFLKGIATQSADAVRRTEHLVDLRKSYHDRLRGPRVPRGLHRLIDELFVIPVMPITGARDVLGVTYPAAKNLMNKLIAAGILGATPRVFRGTQYFFANELLAALEERINEEPGLGAVAAAATK